MLSIFLPGVARRHRIKPGISLARPALQMAVYALAIAALSASASAQEAAPASAQDAAPAKAQEAAPVTTEQPDVARPVRQPFLPKQKPAFHTLSTVLSRKDAQHYKSAFKAIKSRKWKLADQTAARARNPLLAKVIRWLHLTQPQPNASFEELVEFLTANPDWPRQSALRRNVERAINAKTPREKVVAWFGTRPPLTGVGKLKLAEILLAANQNEEGLRLLRDAWVNGKFPSRQERNILRRHRNRLTETDHAARLNRLIWDQQRRGARRMMRRVSNDQRALAFARLSLMQFAGGVDGAIRRVPDALKLHPGLVYERLRWRRRKNFPESAVELLLPPAATITQTGPRPKKWWVERHILLRKMLAKGRVSDAYILARDHGQKDRRWASQAENLAGWIALTHLDDPKLALKHFQKFTKLVRFPVSLARGAYWLGRTYDALGDEVKARARYADAAKYRFTYYGHLAILALGETTSNPLPAEIEPTPAERDAFEASEIVRAVRLLGLLKERKHIRPFLTRLSETAKSPAMHVLTARLALDVGRTDRAVATAKTAARAGVHLPDMNFPIIQVTGHRRVERALQLAVIRQESQFDPEAVSHAGARGLMQLMPATARVVANKVRTRYSRRRLTSDPNYNTRLGSAYLASLIDQYKGSYIMALAAYNAGTPRVRRWVRSNGDPREPDVDPINWVELISISETRNYVQRVLEGLQVFRQRLAGSDSRTPLGLLDDLNR